MDAKVSKTASLSTEHTALSPQTAALSAVIPEALLLFFTQDAAKRGIDLNELITAALQSYAVGVSNSRAGVRRNRLLGITHGRPRTIIDPAPILELRAEGLAWRSIAAKLGASTGTVLRTFNAILTEEEKAARHRAAQKLSQARSELATARSTFRRLKSHLSNSKA
jgi:hypothetical protein